MKPWRVHQHLTDRDFLVVSDRNVYLSILRPFFWPGNEKKTGVSRIVQDTRDAIPWARRRFTYLCNLPKRSQSRSSESFYVYYPL